MKALIDIHIEAITDYKSFQWHYSGLNLPIWYKTLLLKLSKLTSHFKID